MSKDEKVIRRRRFKGRKVTFASQERIEDVYGFVSADVRSGRLVDIFLEIAQRRNRQ